MQGLGTSLGLGNRVEGNRGDIEENQFATFDDQTNGHGNEPNGNDGNGDSEGVDIDNWLGDIPKL
jgi:hypothetical protein